MIRQISVFMENRSGRLNQLLKTLAEASINICSLAIADTGEYGIARLIVDQHEKAMDAIKQSGMTACETEVLAIEADNQPGRLYHATKLLADNDINVEYAYSAIPANHNKAIVIIRVNDFEKAVKVVNAAADIRLIESF